MILELKNFKGLFTNADVEDISLEYLQELKNLEPRNGKLVKSASLISSNALDTEETNIVWTNFYQFQYLDDKMDNTEAYLGYILIGYDTSASNKLVAYCYNNTAGTWHDITTILENTFPTAYQTIFQNPVIEWNNTIRLIPGNDVSTDDEVWVGYIDRAMFDLSLIHI